MKFRIFICDKCSLSRDAYQPRLAAQTGVAQIRGAGDGGRPCREAVAELGVRPLNSHSSTCRRLSAAEFARIPSATRSPGCSRAACGSTLLPCCLRNDRRLPMLPIPFPTLSRPARRCQGRTPASSTTSPVLRLRNAEKMGVWRTNSQCLRRRPMVWLCCDRCNRVATTSGLQS